MHVQAANERFYSSKAGTAASSLCNGLRYQCSLAHLRLPAPAHTSDIFYAFPPKKPFVSPDRNLHLPQPESDSIADVHFHLIFQSKWHRAFFAHIYEVPLPDLSGAESHAFLTRKRSAPALLRKYPDGQTDYRNVSESMSAES